MFVLEHVQDMQTKYMLSTESIVSSHRDLE